MAFRDRMAFPVAQFLRDQSGAAAVELVAAVSVLLVFAAGTGDLGVRLRGQAGLEAAAAEIAVMLARAPAGPDGDISAAAAEAAGAALLSRLAEAGLNAAPIAPPPPGAACVAGGALCLRTGHAAGAEAALGEARRVIQVWAGADAGPALHPVAAGAPGGPAGAPLVASAARMGAT